MSTTLSSVSNFSQSSTWKGYENDAGDTWYSTPSTSIGSKTFSLADVPNNNVIDTAVLTATIGSVYTGAAIRRVEDVTFSGTKDVKSLITKSSGAYNDLDLEFKFKANGGEGTTGQYPDGISHTASLAYSNVRIIITHHAPGSTLSLSATTIPSGSNVTATITPANVAYAHKIKLSIGAHTADASHTYSLIHGNNTQAVSFPGEWLDVIPSGTSTTGKVTLETYTSDTFGTLLSSTEYTITVTVPTDSKPTITSFTTTIVNESGLFNDNTIGRYVKGYSKVKLDVDCGAIDGAHIIAVYISGDVVGTPTLADGVYSLTSEKLTSAKTYTCTVRVTDSRQRFITQDVTFTVYDYSPPAVSSASIYRSNPDGTHNAASGTCMTVNAVLAWSGVNGQNSITATLYHKQSGASTWTNDGAISSGVDKIVGKPPEDDPISADYVYNVKIVITDKVADGSDYPANVASSARALDLWENKGAAVGMRAYRAGFEVKPGLPAYYQGDNLDDRYVRSSNLLSAILAVDTDTSGINATTLKGKTPDDFVVATGYTASDVLSKLLTVDGSGSGLDADKFKGNTTIPVANGGTGGTTAATAKAGIGIQVGRTSSISCAGSDETSFSVTFPTAFSSTPEVFLSLLASSDTRFVTHVMTRNTTGFTATIYNPGTTQSPSVAWLATNQT